MLIAQITDLHLGFEPDRPDEPNRRRLDAVIAALDSLPRRPDLILATGDLVDRGDVESYRRLREAFAATTIPVAPALGNHDDRDAFASVFPERALQDGFVQYAIEDGALRILVLDTLDPGRHGGAFCEARAQWLRARLDEAPERPTLLVLHHPPIETGIDWMTVDPSEPWIARLAACLAGRQNVAGLVSGHIHRAIATRWEGHGLAVCPSTAPQVALTLEAIDPDAPDGRPMIVDGPPAYGLHLWTGSSLVSHFDSAADYPVLAAYDARMQPLVQHLIEERVQRR